MMKVEDEGLLVTMSKHVNETSHWITEQAMLRCLHPREIYELYCDMLIKPYKSMERAIEINRKNREVGKPSLPAERGWCQIYALRVNYNISGIKIKRGF